MIRCVSQSKSGGLNKDNKTKTRSIKEKAVIVLDLKKSRLNFPRCTGRDQAPGAA